MPADNSIAGRSKRGALALKASKPFVARFFARARAVNDCLLIGQNPSRYGRVRLTEDAFMPAHRFALITYSQEHRPDMFACHTCLQKNCIAKAHLYWGTPQQNALDMDLHGTRRLPYSKSGYRRPINKEKAREIAFEITKHGKSLSEIAEDFKVSATVVRNILTGRAWKHATSDIVLDRKERESYFFGPYGEYHNHAKIDEDTAKKIISLAADGLSLVNISKKLGISKGITKDVRSGATWSHLARPDSVKQGARRPPVFVSKALARKIYTLFHWHGLSLGETSLKTGISRGVVSRICQKLRQAKDTDGLKSRHHLGHKNRVANRNLPGIKLCEICDKPFDYKAMGLKARKKTCSKTCLSESRRRTALISHAEGKIFPATKFS